MISFLSTSNISGWDEFFIDDIVPLLTISKENLCAPVYGFILGYCSAWSRIDDVFPRLYIAYEFNIRSLREKIFRYLANKSADIYKSVAFVNLLEDLDRDQCQQMIIDLCHYTKASNDSAWWYKINFMFCNRINWEKIKKTNYFKNFEKGNKKLYVKDKSFSLVM